MLDRWRFCNWKLRGWKLGVKTWSQCCQICLRRLMKLPASICESAGGSFTTGSSQHDWQITDLRKISVFFFLKAWSADMFSGCYTLGSSMNVNTLLPKHQTGRLELFCSFGCKITKYFWSFRNNLEIPKHSSLYQELSRTHFLTHSDLLNSSLPCFISLL